MALGPEGLRAQSGGSAASGFSGALQREALKSSSSELGGSGVPGLLEQAFRRREQHMLAAEWLTT